MIIMNEPINYKKSDTEYYFHNNGTKKGRKTSLCLTTSVLLPESFIIPFGAAPAVSSEFHQIAILLPESFYDQ